MAERANLNLSKYKGWYVTVALGLAIAGVLVTHLAGAMASIWRVVKRHAVDLDGATSDAERQLRDLVAGTGGAVGKVEEQTKDFTEEG